MNWITGTLLRSVVAAALPFLLSPAISLAQTTVEVQMTNGLSFSPSVVSVNLGDTVRWINVSTSLPHTATAFSGSARRDGFNSGLRPRSWLQPGEVFEFTFTMPGEFPYFCIPHLVFGMQGTVIVNAAATGTTPLFTASAEEGRVVLRWRIGRGDRSGFHVLRSRGWGEEVVQINDHLISVQGDAAGEAEYTFTDESIIPGTEYLYILEEVRGQAGASLMGPAVAVAR
ncbi:MAG: cupredoxin domain-containing protein [Candidatus Rokubacteria bacterium]|nr:cupredoxin domain-containing protein [Candidatus Rokubacteria bacterium]